MAMLWTECCIPSKYIFETLIPTVMMLGSGELGSDQITKVESWMRLVPYERDPRELSWHFAMWGWSKKNVIYEPGSKSSADAASVDVLILDFPAFGTLRNKVYSLSHSVYSNLL